MPQWPGTLHGTGIRTSLSDSYEWHENNPAQDEWLDNAGGYVVRHVHWKKRNKIEKGEKKHRLWLDINDFLGLRERKKYTNTWMIKLKQGTLMDWSMSRPSWKRASARHKYPRMYWLSFSTAFVKYDTASWNFLYCVSYDGVFLLSFIRKSKKVCIIFFCIFAPFFFFFCIEFKMALGYKNHILMKVRCK